MDEIEEDEVTIPHYAVHDEISIKGFFGPYRFLSNFYPAETFYDGIWFPSSENAFQAAKSNNFSVRQSFIHLSAGQSKKLGKGIAIRNRWESMKRDIMYQIVIDKFVRNPELAEALVKTGVRHLEETNHWKDTYWGVCDGEGKNNLGKILMFTRQLLING